MKKEWKKKGRRIKSMPRSHSISNRWRMERPWNFRMSYRVLEL
jgi:hypothetical protein